MLGCVNKKLFEPGGFVAITRNGNVVGDTYDIRKRRDEASMYVHRLCALQAAKMFPSLRLLAPQGEAPAKPSRLSS